jgi:hypothetical protein
MNSLAKLLGFLSLGLVMFPTFSHADSTVLCDLNDTSLWEVYRWNKAPMVMENSPEFPQDAKVVEGAKKGSIRIVVNWPGGGVFKFSSLNPKQPAALPDSASSIGIWIKGASQGHTLEMGFTDADGHDKDENDKPYKISFGVPNKEEWGKISRPIPATWKHPVTLRSLVFHNLRVEENAVEMPLWLAQVEVE